MVEYDLDSTTELTLTIFILSDMIPCSLVARYEGFEGTYFLIFYPEQPGGSYEMLIPSIKIYLYAEKIFHIQPSEKVHDKQISQVL